MHSTPAKLVVAAAVAGTGVLLPATAKFSAQPLGVIIQEFASNFSAWISDGYDRAPALVLGLALLLSLPPLILVGSALRRSATGPNTGSTTAAPEDVPWELELEPQRAVPGEAPPAWPSKAWIELDSPAPGRPPIRLGIDPPLIRIGRDAENDVCLRDTSVHRFHAAVYRSEDAEYFIKDLTDGTGHGIFVNGMRITNTRLVPGDGIKLGNQRLKFFAEPA